MTIRILVVDDEPLAREGVMLRLREEGGVEIVAECENGNEAIRAIETLKPDLVFLDIRMPRVGGFDVIQRVGAEAMPPVIFLTAYEEHAIEAFRHNALDYLLKPIDKDRFRASMAKARKQINEHRLAEQGSRLQGVLREMGYLPSVTEGEDGPEKITLRSSGHVYFLAPDEINWVESEGDYVSVHIREKSHLVRDTMRAMENRLASRGFLRIHRSAIVNLNKIRELKVIDEGEYLVLLMDGTSLKVGRNYRNTLFQKMKV